MAFPQEPTAPDTVGTQPKNAAEMNALVGQHMRQFLAAQAVIKQDQSFLASTDLTAAPYHFDADQQTLIKSAYADLNTALQAIDLTFISRLVGMA